MEKVVEKIKEILKQNGYTKRLGPESGFHAWVIQDAALVQVHDGNLPFLFFTPILFNLLTLLYLIHYYITYKVASKNHATC